MPRRGRGRPPHPDVLTPAEWQVLDWIRHGVTRREIARRRRTSLDAVKYHVTNITAKLGLESSRQLRDWPGYPATSRITTSRLAPSRITATRITPSRLTATRITATRTTTSEERPMPAAPANATPPTLELGPLAQVSLYVRDVNRAEQFYGETLGLPHHFTFGDLAFFDLHGTRLYLHAVDEEHWKPGSILYFLVDDIDAAYGSLNARGVRTTGAPHNIYTDEATGTEEWMAFFEDGEGNALALLARVDGSARG